jgi:hypothetical protein
MNPMQSGFQAVVGSSTAIAPATPTTHPVVALAPGQTRHVRPLLCRMVDAVSVPASPAPRQVTAYQCNKASRPPRLLPLLPLPAKRHKMVRDGDLKHRSAGLGIAHFRRSRSNLFASNAPEIRIRLVGHQP